jgi:hypothetical protein
MATGLAGTTAQSMLKVYQNVSYTAIATVYMQLHTNAGDPGAAGTANVSAVTTRNLVTWNAATTAGSMTLSSIAGYSMTTTETIAYVSFWTASTAGTFLQSAALTSSQAVINGSTLNFTTCTLSFSPIAA